MSAQINLYHERFRKKLDLLTLTNVVAAGSATLLLVLISAALATASASSKQAQAKVAAAEFKVVKDEFDAVAKIIEARKPSQQLIDQIASTELQLQRRGEVANQLEGGVIGNTAGFANYLSGLARHVPDGLWLTGFKIDAGGNEMEIRGRMLNPVVLPEYIRRLGTEKVFHGRNFAALTMDRPAESQAAKLATPATSAVPTPRYVEFVLTPRLAEAKSERGDAQ